MIMDVVTAAATRWCGTDYPDWYADSSGRVYRSGVEVIPYPIDKHHRYLRVWCHVRGRVDDRRQVDIHTLVCTAFRGPRPDGMECRHLNDVKSDNRAVNLCWGTQSENARDAVRNGGQVSHRGEKHGRAKLTDGDVRAIRLAYDGPRRGVRRRCSQAELAATYGVSQVMIGNIVRRKSWIHVSDDPDLGPANF